MTGTQSLSFNQLQTVNDEVNLLEIQARRSLRWVDTISFGRMYVGQPVTIVIDSASQYGNVPPKGADKRVSIHRAYTGDSRHFWLSREGEILN